MACGAYLIWGVLCINAYVMGLTKVPLIILVAGFAGNFIVNVLVYIVFRTGLNKRFNDPSLTLLQMLIATFWTMVVVYYAYEARSAVLLVYMVVLVFGFFRLRIQQFLFLSVFALMNYAAIIFILHKTHPEYLNTKIDMFNIVVLACILPWFAMIGGYITNLRNKVADALATLERMNNNILDVIFVLDMNLNYTYISPSVNILRGYEPEEVLKQPFADAFTPSSLALVMKTLSGFMELEKAGLNVPSSETLQLEVKRKDGTIMWTETKFSIIRERKKPTVRILGVMRDISERKDVERQKDAAVEALLKSEKYFKEITENSSDILVIADKNGCIKYCSRSIERFTGYKPEDLIGKNAFDYLHPEEVKRASDDLSKAIVSKDSLLIPHSYRIIHKNGSEIYLDGLGRNLLNNPDIAGVVMNVRDVTDKIKAEAQKKAALEALQKSEQRYQELSIIDELTQLYNSRHFYDQLKKEIDRSNRYEHPLSLLLLDLDRFKNFNDAYGHLEGDNVLKRLGQAIKRCMRETDSAYRYGGEEFTIILPMTTSEEGMITAQRIQMELQKEAFEPVSGQIIYMTVSIGLSQYRPQEDIKAFVHRVDQLMYQAKKNGRNRICTAS